MSRAAAVFAWYVREYQRRPSDLGTLRMFSSRQRVGHFAVSMADVRREDAAALFKLLVAVTPFQRRQDQQVMRILRGLSAEEVADMTDMRSLLRRCASSPCTALRSSTSLREECDLTKDAKTRLGRCARNPGVACHLKRHTVLLKRYGHFGKVPSSAALALKEAGARSVSALRRSIWRREDDPTRRAIQLEAALMRAWRISRKIAAMYLSMLTTPGLGARVPVWRGCDSTRFVVIDSNTDLFLRALGYRGPWTYDARLDFITRLADAVADQGVATNGRLLQQAMYTFMGRINRRANPADCSLRQDACRGCQADVKRLCPLRT